MQKENKDIAGQGKEAYTEDEMANRIPLLSDIVFKYIFGTEESTDILKTFSLSISSCFPAIFPATAALCCRKTTTPGTS